MSSGARAEDLQKCEGCGIEFKPTLEGEICPTCVEIIIENGLDPDDWEQYKLQVEYDVV